MIVLQKLKWSNCFSYGADNELILNNDGLTQILGDNGAGKSSIPLIIEEVLFNKNSKGANKADIPNRYLNKPYYISLDFSVDEDEYNINVHRKSSLKVVLTKNGENISSHTATNTFKTVSEILGVDFKTFSQLVYQNTRNSLQFLTATDTNRKKFLIDLLNLSKYVEYFEIFKQKVREHNTKIEAMETKVSTIEAWLSKNNLEGMKVLTPIKLEINTENDEKELASLQSEFENISEKNKKISKNNQLKKQLSSIDLSIFSSVDESMRDTHESLTREIGTLNAVIAQSKKTKDRIDKLGLKCPTCCQSIDKEFKHLLLAEADKSLQEASEKALQLSTKIDEIKATNALIDKKQRTQRDFESIYSSIDNDLQEEILDGEELSRKIESIKAALAKARKKQQEIIQENIRIEKNNTRLLVIQEQTEEFQKQLESSNSELDECRRTYKNLEILKKAFSTNGLLAYKIEYLVKELEDIVNDYLGELSDGRFTLTFAISKDKLNVLLTDNGKEVSIDSLSSGELARVNTSTLLAIRKLMNSISKSRINVLFLDEVMGVLDDLGREKLVSVLVKELKLNTFIVSHEWSHPLLSKLSIVKEDDISRIDYG